MNFSWQIVRFNLKETFSISYGSYNFREALIVSLSHKGYKGYGECTSIDYYNINLDDFTAKLHLIQSQIESQKILHPTDFYQFLLTLNLHSFLRSAIDCAYWDLFGKLEKRSFLELNSIEIKQLPESSITISVAPVDNQIQKIKSSHWTKFKVKCNHFDANAIQKLLDLDYNIALDSNASFTKDNCLQIQDDPKFSKFSYLEQPMKTGLENYKFLTADASANWMADEDCHSVNDLQNLQSHYKSINIKLVKCGGLTPALALLSEARKLNFKIMIGCMTESTIGISADAMVAPLCDYADLDGANLIENDSAKGTKIVNGRIQLSEKSGLGIELI